MMASADVDRAPASVVRQQIRSEKRAVAAARFDAAGG